MKKEVGITIKSKQTSNQLEPVTINISYIGYTVISQSQMHAQIEHPLVHLHDLIPTLAGIYIYIYMQNTLGIKSCRFICVCIWL